MISDYISAPKLSQAQAIQLAKVVIWVGVSAAITKLAELLSDRPDIFGPALVPVVNVLLVALVNLFRKG